MPRDPRAYLYDVVEAADRIARFTRDLTAESYRADELVRSAVERQFTVIGEAITKLNRHAPELAERLTHRSQIIAFRNILIHAYASIDSAIVWDIVAHGLAVLRQEAAGLMDELDAAAGD